jgi:hypothetical protein
MPDKNSLVRPDHMLEDHREYGEETAAAQQGQRSNSNKKAHN